MAPYLHLVINIQPSPPVSNRPIYISQLFSFLFSPPLFFVLLFPFSPPTFNTFLPFILSLAPFPSLGLDPQPSSACVHSDEHLRLPLRMSREERMSNFHYASRDTLREGRAGLTLPSREYVGHFEWKKEISMKFKKELRRRRHQRIGSEKEGRRKQSR